MEYPPKSMRINKEKSIAWGRLMYRLNFFTVLGILMDYFFWAMGMAGGLVFYFMGLQNTGLFPTVLEFFSGAFLLYMGCGAHLLGKLVKIQGVDPATNKARIVGLIRAKYPKMDVASGEWLITAQSELKYFAFDRRFIILLDGNDLYLNAYTLGRGDLKYFFLAIPNHLSCRALAREFRLMAG
jgi:hypothetical protein